MGHKTHFGSMIWILKKKKKSFGQLENHNQHFKKPPAALLYTYQSQNAFFAVKGLPPVLYSLNSLQKCKHDLIKIGEYVQRKRKDKD